MLLAVVTPPPQLNVAPVVVDDAVNVTVVLAQVSTAGAAIPAFGATVFWVTVAEIDAVHPLAGSVTVTLYIDGTETVLAAVVMPPPQLNVAPVVVDDAVKVSLVVVQVRTTGVAMLALGKLMFCVTVVEAVLVHPLVGSVTVTV